MTVSAFSLRNVRLNGDTFLYNCLKNMVLFTPSSFRQKFDLGVSDHAENRLLALIQEKNVVYRVNKGWSSKELREPFLPNTFVTCNHRNDELFGGLGVFKARLSSDNWHLDPSFEINRGSFLSKVFA